jgi:hypothetical protein
MTRLRLVALFVLAAAAGACDAGRSIGPANPASSPELALRHTNSVGEEARALVCTRREAQQGSALIGPAGGTLIVGQNQLIIPPGALREPTMIVGTVPPDVIPTIRLEPSGLIFERPAGLRLDVTGCELADSVPDIVYVDDAGIIRERIAAVFSNLWKTIAAPIDHFSAYQIAM